MFLCFFGQLWNFGNVNDHNGFREAEVKTFYENKLAQIYF